MDHPVVVTFLIIAIVASMALAAEVLKPLALAILLSFALAPLTRFLERRGLPRVLSVVLTVVLALGALGGIGYAVEKQLTALANELPRYQGNIEGKLQRLIKPHQETALTKANKVAQDVAAQLSEPPVKVRPREVQNVRIVEEPSFRERLQAAVGPYLEFLSIGFFVLILVLFILLNREDLADRIIRLFGNRQISLTTRTMSEVGQRVSRYLATFALVNSMFGLIVGLGLAAFGIEYAMLWGFLAAVLRFIPYVGPATAFALPLLFSVARYDTWRQPLEVLALFGVLEVMANSFLEPIIYGKSTGVSALGLLVAAMFWTWLWGALGLLLSTPLTVCLAVLGKYVPSLSVFAVILGEEPALEPEVKFYQRLLALDEDGANAIIEAELKKRPRVEVFDEVLIPTLSRAERDRAREEIDERDQAFVLRVVGDILDDLEGTSELSLDALAPTAQGEAGGAVEARVLGVASNDQADALALRMLALALAPSGCTLEVLTETESPLQLSEAVAGRAPTLVVLSHLPPLGLTPARYLVRRLRARLPQLPILVGRWGEGGDPAEVAERLTAVGASRVVFTLAEARDQVLAAVLPKPQETQATALQPF
ncbi:MAG: AI-2E family transporter [Isosphaeraceae bacterium]|nr:AI-2E family transporter [Isosphaeraceae bacterium]